MQPTREDIERLQATISRMPQHPVVTRHHFANGLYIREVEQPAGMVVVGKVHKTQHFFLVLKGELTVTADGTRRRLVAPAILTCEPGTKRALFAHVDCIYANVHRVSSTDLDEVERELVEHDPQARFDARNQIIALEGDPWPSLPPP